MGMKNRSTRHQNSRRGPYHCLGITSVLALAIAGVTPTASNAYTAAGDRNFPAQLILPQIGPTDALWFPISTLPMEALKTTDPTRVRSEEHTSELQSHSDLVCRLLLEKKKV